MLFRESQDTLESHRTAGCWQCFFPPQWKKNTAGSWECCQVVPGFLLFCYELSTRSLQCIPLTSWEAKDGLFCLTHPSPIYLQQDFLKN